MEGGGKKVTATAGGGGGGSPSNSSYASNKAAATSASTTSASSSSSSTAGSTSTGGGGGGSLVHRLRDLDEAGIFEEREAIAAISLRASAEHALETTLEKVECLYSQIEFLVKPLIDSTTYECFIIGKPGNSPAPDLYLEPTCLSLFDLSISL